MDKDTLEKLSLELGAVSILVRGMKARVDKALIDEPTAEPRETIAARVEPDAVPEEEDITSAQMPALIGIQDMILSLLADAGEALTVERIMDVLNGRHPLLKLWRATCLRLLGALENDGKIAVVTTVAPTGEPEERYELADEDADPDVETRHAILKVIADRDGALTLYEIAAGLGFSGLDAGRLLRELVDDGKVVKVRPAGEFIRYDLAAFAGKHEAPEEEGHPESEPLPEPQQEGETATCRRCGLRVAAVHGASAHVCYDANRAEAPTVHLRTLVPEVAASLREVRKADVDSRPSLRAAEVGPASLAAALASGLVGVNSGVLYLTPEGHQALIDHDKAVAERDEAPAEEERERNPGRDVRINDDEACILSALDEPKATELLFHTASLAGIAYSTFDRLKELQLLWIAEDDVVYRTSLGHRALRNYERAEAERVRSRCQEANKFIIENDGEVPTNPLSPAVPAQSPSAHHGPGVRRYEDWEDDGDPS